MATTKRAGKQASRLDAANKARKAKAKVAQAERQRALAKLKKLDLYTGNSRAGAKTSYGASLVRKYADVVSGKAKVVKADKATEREYRSAGGRGAHSRVVVEVQKGERVRFNKRTKQIEGIRTAYGNTSVRAIKFQRVFDPKKIPKARLKKGETAFYQAHFVKGDTANFESLDELLHYMGTYKQAQSANPEVVKRFNSYWASHVSTIVITGDPDNVEWEEEYTDIGRSAVGLSSSED